MSAFSTIPLKILNSSGDLKQLTSLEEELFVNEGGLALVGEYDSVGARYGGSLTVTNTANDSDIGSYTDTFFTSPVGTHPGTSISSGSTTTTLRQMTDSVYELPFTGIVENLIVADSNGDLHDMDSASYNELSKRVNEIVQTQEGVGTFRLSATAPSSEYEKWIDTVFTDTLVNGGNTDYHIWRKFTINVDPEAYYPIKRTGDNTFQEMTASEVGEVGNGMIQQGFFLNGVGAYELRSDSDGAPTASGTWEARGTALDTKNTIQDVQYATVQYTSPQFSRQYTGQYAGTFINNRNSVVPQNFVGVRQINYAGQRFYSSTFVGVRSGPVDFAGTRPNAQNFVGQRTFTGSRAFAGARNYAGNFTSNFLGSRNYAGTFESAPANFLGERTFLGSRQANFLGIRFFSGSRNFSGLRQFVGTDIYLGVRFYSGSRVFTPQFSGSRSYTGNFTGGNATYTVTSSTGVRVFVGFYPFGEFDFVGTRQFIDGVTPGQQGIPVGQPTANTGYTGTRNFSGQRTYTTSSNTHFSGASYTGVRSFQHVNPGGLPDSNFIAFTGPAQYTGGTQYFSPIPWLQQFTSSPIDFLGPVAQNFVGTRNFLGTRNFAGNRDYSAQFGVAYAGVRSYSDQYTGTGLNFTGDVTFAGVRNFASTFVGVRSFTDNFVGTRSYTGNFIGPTTQTFLGSRTVLYTGYYTGQYTGQYTSTYTSQYSNQYTGQTVVAVPETVRTYTLYVRVSET